MVTLHPSGVGIGNVLAGSVPAVLFVGGLLWVNRSNVITVEAGDPRSDSVVRRVVRRVELGAVSA
jgi:hypothetical protein